MSIRGLFFDDAQSVKTDHCQCFRCEGVTGINTGQVSVFLHTNIHCDPSLELSRRGKSNKGSQHMFSVRDKKNISKLSLLAPS